MLFRSAYFAFQTRPGEDEFVFKLTDDNKIAEARNILNGKQANEVHVMGRILKKSEPYNPLYTFNFNPDTIQFFSIAIEICDASLMYVEDHLDEACGAFLPGCFFCPWTSKLIREVKV